MQASLSTFGIERIVLVERDVATAAPVGRCGDEGGRSGPTPGPAAAERVETRVDGLDADVAALWQQIAQMPLDLAAMADSAARAPAAAASSGSTGTEDRLTARVENLGWDDSAVHLARRAREVLSLANVDPATHGPVAPITKWVGVGSAVELHFGSQAALAAARVAVKPLGKEYAAGRTVWRDRRQSVAEAAAASFASQSASVARSSGL